LLVLFVALAPQSWGYAPECRFGGIVSPESYFDPVWNFANASGYSFCGGDPINRFDADGRLAKGVVGGYVEGDFYQPQDVAQMAGQFVGQLGAGLTPYWGQAADVRDTTAAVNAIRNEGLGWGTGLGMAAAVAAWVPGVGDAVKGIVKPVVRLIDDVPAGSFTPSSGSSFQPITDPSRLLPAPQQPLALLPEYAESLAAKRAGTLTKIGEDAWQSSGGLKYVGLDKNGLNRIEHVLQHVAPGVPGKSVFNVPRNQILGLLDEAYASAARVPVPGVPAAFITPMGRTVGTAGENAVRLILRPGTSEVISAYPVKFP